MLGTHGAKYLLKNIPFVIWYIFYLRWGWILYNSNSGIIWQNNNYFYGLLMVFYPITLCHLESYRKNGESLNFKNELWNQFSGIQQTFVIIPWIISLGIFWLFNFMIFIELINLFK